MKPIVAIGAWLFTTVLVCPLPAAAQTRAAKAGARAAADAGADAFDAGRYADAADLFERAERLLHAPPHLLYAARSHAKLGHFVEAHELYLTLTREQLPPSAPRAFREAQQQGEKELAALEPRLAYVSVVVRGGAGASSVRVTRNGEDVPAELMGVATPINPGEYTFRVVAEGMEGASTVSFREGARETVVLTLRDRPSIKVDGEAAPPPPHHEPAPRAAVSSSWAAPLPADSRSSGGRPFLVGAVAGFGFAVAGGVVGTLFLVRGLERQNAANDAVAANCDGPCSPNVYETKVKPLDDEAASKKNVALVSYLVGGVGIGTGITFLVIDQTRVGSTANARVTPVIGLGYAGVSGRF